jgi:hypothetical protein
MLNVKARRGMPTGFWWENLKERGYLEDLGVSVSMILRWIINK